MTEPDPRPKRKSESQVDLQTQLEALLHQVWLCEAEWRFDDRLALSLATTRQSRDGN